MREARDIGVNPVTNQLLRDTPLQRSDELQSTQAAADTLKASGFVPLSERRAGALKLGIFRLASIIPFVGLFGAWCANRQAMGSQKQQTFIEKHSFLRDFGETYLNATVGRNYDDSGGKTLRKLTKFWSESLGSGFHLLGLTSDEGSMTDYQRRLKRIFRENFTKQFGRSPSPELMKSISVERLMELSDQRKRADEAGVCQEYKAILRRQAEKYVLSTLGYQSVDELPERSRVRFEDQVEKNMRYAALTYGDIKNGRENLKVHFAKYLESEQDLESLYLEDWADRSLRHAGITTDDPDERRYALHSATSTYQLSKYDMLAGFDGFVRSKTKYSVGIDESTQKRWEKLYLNHLVPYQTSLREAEDAYLDCKKARAALSIHSKDYGRLARKQEELGQKLQEIKSERFDSKLSRDFGRGLHSLFELAEDSLEHHVDTFDARLRKEYIGD